ncbi:hypothetical protein JCM19045_1790 [Bacillus sp. JCM 19045]|nr:hypothetical protein JCM19045_1790 [Bacillus sp. JCM 19045]
MPCLKYPILALAATGTWKLTNASKKVVFPVPLSPTIASLLPVMISFGEKNFGMNYAIVFLGYSGGAFVGPRIAPISKKRPAHSLQLTLSPPSLEALVLGSWH